MSYEDHLINSIDYRSEHKMSDQEWTKTTHEKIMAIMDQERPNPIDFNDVVDPEKIRKDVTAVRDMESRWKSNNNQGMIEMKRNSDFAEYIIFKNLPTWIEYKASAVIPAKADDYLRGIDLIVESEQLDKQGKLPHLGLGIDVALVSDKNYSTGLETKKAKMKKNLEEGKLTEARYVEGAKFHGTLEDLPYTILSVSPQHIEELMPNMVRKGVSMSEKNHILKYIVAYQIRRQLGAYYQVSEKLGFSDAAKNYGIANNFAVDIFDSLMNELETNTMLWQQVANDPGVMEIEKFLTKLEQEHNLT